MPSRSLAMAAVLACAPALASEPPPPEPAPPLSFSALRKELRQLEGQAAAGGPALTAGVVASLYRRWFDALIRPCLGPAQRDPAALLCLIHAYAQWRWWLKGDDRRLSLPSDSVRGLLGREVEAALDAMQGGFEIAYAGAARKCMDARDPSQAWLLLRLIQEKDLVCELFGLDGRMWPGVVIDEAIGCLMFEVTLRSTLDGRSTDGLARVRHVLEAKAPALLNVEELPPRHVDLLERWALAGNEAARRILLREGLRLGSWPGVYPWAQVTSKLESEWHSDRPGFGGDRKVVRVRFEIEELGVELESYDYCEGRAPPEPRWFVSYSIHQGPMDSEDFLTFYWRDLHREESAALLGSANGYHAAGLVKGSRDVYVGKDYRGARPAGGYVLAEDTRLEVRHSPGTGK